MKRIVSAALVVSSLFLAGDAFGQGLTANEVLDNLTAGDITEALVALNGFVGNPGIGGLRIHVENNPGQPDIEYSKSHFLLQKDFWLPGRNLALYGALDLGRVKQEDPFIAENARGEPLRFDMDRRVDTGRIGLGVAFMATRHVRIRPYLSFALSRIESKSNISGDVDINTFTPEIQAAFTDWNEQSRTFAGTIDVKYNRFWEQKRRFEASVNYSHASHESFDEDLPILEFSGRTDTVNVMARYSGNTGHRLYGLPLWWNGRAEGIFFPGLEEDDLGFTYYVKLGGGLDLERPTAIMDIKLYRTVGIEASAIIGDNLIGGGIGISLRL